MAAHCKTKNSLWCFIHATAYSSSEVLFNILAPGVQEWHFTTGFSHEVSEKVQLNAMAFYSPAKKVSGANFLAPNQQLSIEMQQSGVGVSIVWGI